MSRSTQPSVSAQLYPYRYALLFVAFFVHCCLQFGILIVPGLAGTLMTQYGLTPTQFSMVATMPYLTGFLFGIASGTWADRKSIRQVMIIGLALAFLGAAGRMVSTSFVMLLASSFLMGFALAALNANSTKIMRLWFPGKTTSVAMGVYILGATIGAMLALKLGPTMSVAFAFRAAAIAVLAGLLAWIILGRTHPDGEAAAAESIGEHLGEVLKSKNVWLVSVFMFALFGCTVTEQTFSNVAFTTLSGSAAIAGTISALNTIAVGIGGIVMPLLISRMKTLKPVMIASALVNALLLFSVLSIGYGPMTYFLIIFQGLLLGVLLPMGKTLPALLPDVRAARLGAAGGFQSMLQNLGAWLIPAYIITPIATAITGATPVSLYIGAGACTVVCAVCMALVPETGTSVEAKMQREAALPLELQLAD